MAVSPETRTATGPSGATRWAYNAGDDPDPLLPARVSNHSASPSLGAVAMRRDVPEDRARDLSAVLKEAVAVGMEHREEALAYAIEYGRGIAPDLNDRFVAMYVNDLTLDYGERGRTAVDRKSTRLNSSH